MIKTLVFDIDGVTVIGEMFGKNMQQDFGFSIDKLAPFFKGKFQDCLIGKADLKDELQNFIINNKLPITSKALLEYWFLEENNPNKALLEEITYLRAKGLKCFLATNQEKYRTKYLINEMGFGRYFDGIIASFQAEAKKPSRQFYTYLLSVLSGIKKEEILFFDDNLENVIAANQFGINAEVYSSLQGFEEQLLRYGIE